MPASSDIILKRFLASLKEEQLRCIELLVTPNNPTEFGYGKASGILHGLRRAEQLFDEVIGEEEDRT
jgi:hypothetical protein